jgi:hypothetical protein
MLNITEAQHVFTPESETIVFEGCLLTKCLFCNEWKGECLAPAPDTACGTRAHLARGWALLLAGFASACAMGCILYGIAQIIAADMAAR